MSSCIRPTITWPRALISSVLPYTSATQLNACCGGVMLSPERCEQHDRRLDVAQVERRGRSLPPQPVADEQVLRDPLDLLAVQQEVAAPPAFELEEALRLGVDVGEQVVVLVPERVGRIEVLEVLHQPGAVELAGAEVGRERGEPRAAEQAAGVAHRVVAVAVAPGAAPVRHRRADDHDRAGVVGAGGGQHHRGQPPWQLPTIAGLGASGCSSRTRRTNSRSALHTSSSVWPGSGSRKKTTK